MSIELPAAGSSRRAASRALAQSPVARSAAPRIRYRSVLWSFLRWNLALARWRLLNLSDTLRGRGSLDAKAHRLRQAIEAMGGTGVLVGQQLAMRIDLMPLEFSLALAAMLDLAPPLEPGVATARIERAIGGPLSGTFEAFDPAPISSTTAFCTYRARLVGGREVAIKVRRPGVRRRLMADLVALGWITRALEASTLWRPGFFASLQRDLLDLANQRLDLTFQGRYQTVFRRLVRRDGPRWLSAPRTHPHLSDRTVLVRDLEQGVPLSDVLAAADRGGAELDSLSARGIDPARVARRLLHTAWWGAFESLFYVAGPDPSEILVREGDRLVLLDLGDCSSLSSGDKRHFQRVLQSLCDDDVSAAAHELVQVLSPLPFIDVFDLTRRIETGLWQELLALRDPRARWWERTTLGLWRTAVRAAREDGVSLRMDTLRFMAATLSYDTLAARLDPDLRLLGLFARYRRAADARAARRYRRALDALDADDLQARWVAGFGRLSETLERALVWAESSVEQLPITNLALAGKAAYAVSQGVRAAGWIAALLLAFVAAHALSDALDGRAPELTAALHRTLGGGWFGLAAAAIAGLTVRRVLFRLDDKQPA